MYTRTVELPDITAHIVTASNPELTYNTYYRSIEERIKADGYIPETSMENLIMMIFWYYEDSDEIRERGYFGIQDTRKYPDNLMVNIPDIEEYVIASGGLEVFDFEI